MNVRDRLLAALKLENVDRIPVSSVTQVGIVEAMKIIDVYWPEAHFDSNKMAKLGASLYNLVGLEAVRIPFCLTVEAEAIGCKVKIGTIDTQPSVSDHLGAIPEDLPDSSFLNKGRIPTVLDAARLLRAKYPEAPVIVGITGPMTLTGHILGVENVLRYMIKDINILERTLNFSVELSKIYIEAISKTGADVICVADPTASPEITPPAMFNQLIKPALHKVAQKINNSCLSVLHICGRIQKILPQIPELGFNALSIEEKVDAGLAREILGSKVAVVGNVSSANTLLNGPPEKIKEEATKAIKYVNVLAPGCGLAPLTPIRHIQALVEVVKK